jgi:NAD(P)-dependent dehydrogenase (short-subunit alcohol dehydrogenase family)
MIASAIEYEQILGFARESTPLGRLARRPEETTRGALFNASGEESYMNGAIVPVDGGWTAR